MISDGKIEDYNILSSLRVGKKVIFLCENEKAPEGQKYGCGFAEGNDLFEHYSDVEVSDDYMEVIKLYSARISDEVQAMETELSEIDVPLSVIGKAECYPNDYDESIKGKVIAIRADLLIPEYQRADRQIYLVTGGFGAEANARGRAVYCVNIHTGKETRFNREDVQGVIKPECMPEWANNRLLIIRQDKSVFEYEGKHYIPSACSRKLSQDLILFQEISVQKIPRMDTATLIFTASQQTRSATCFSALKTTNSIFPANMNYLLGRGNGV